MFTGMTTSQVTASTPWMMSSTRPLPVARYAPNVLRDEFGGRFTLVDAASTCT